MEKPPDSGSKAMAENAPGALAKSPQGSISTLQLEGGSNDPIRTAIDTAFINEKKTREGLAENLSQRAKESHSVKKLADDAFLSFSPSRFTEDARSKPNYIAARGDLMPALETVIGASVTTLRTSGNSRSLQIRDSDAFLKLVNTKGAAGSNIGTILIDDLIDYIGARAAALALGGGLSTSSGCNAEDRAEELLLGIEAGEADVNSSPSEHPDDHKHELAPELDTRAEARALVSKQVEQVMGKAVAPEDQLRFDVPSRSDRLALQHSIETFQLRSGPSDVTSYHDFTNLQIAFEHVWTEVFDHQLTGLGKRLYSEYVKLKKFMGISDVEGRTIKTIDDLSRFISEVRELGRIVDEDTPADLKPPSGAAEQWPSGASSGTLPDDPGGQLYQAFAGKPTITWDSFETKDSTEPKPLPLEGDRITVAFETGVVARGSVEIVIANTDSTWWWKGIVFTEYGSNQTILETKSAATNPDKWNPSRTNTIKVATTQLRSGILEFQKDAPRGFGGWQTGFYLLTRLDQKLEDRMRVTFTWVKD